MIPSLKITLAGFNDQYSWDSYVLGHPLGIAYQLYGFRHAMERAYGLKGSYFIARKGGKIVGVLPLVHFSIPGTRGSLLSLPYCDAAGPLADTAAIEKRLVVHGVAYAGENRIHELRIRSIAPFAGIDPDLTLYSGKARMILRLPNGPDALFPSLKSKVRSQIKKALGHGLRFQIGGKDLLDPFFKIFSENMRDLGSPVHSRKWMGQILSGFGNRAHIGIVRLPDQTPVAAGIILCHTQTVSIPWASSLRRYNYMNPNMLLYWQFLKFSAAGGFLHFDFGRSTPGEGTFRFKRQWGAIPRFLHWGTFKVNVHNPLSLESVKCPSQSNTCLSNSARQYIALGIRQMPVSLSLGLGGIARRYISL